MKVRLRKPLPTVVQNVKMGEEYSATPCTHVKKAFNLFNKDHIAVEWCVPEEYLEEIL